MIMTRKAILLFMREIIQNINDTVNSVKELQGIRVTLNVNRGRNKFETIEGIIEDAYPKIFTVRKTDGELSSFSYSDILCNNIKFS